MYLLDTNVVSELRKVAHRRADQQAVRWLAHLDASRLYISVITLMEIELGILLLMRKDTRQGSLLRTWMETRVLPEFSDRTLPINKEIALRCAKLHVPDPKPERDALIAATALIHGMTLVTRNIADFAAMDIPLINPWEA